MAKSNPKTFHLHILLGQMSMWQIILHLKPKLELQWPWLGLRVVGKVPLSTYWKDFMSLIVENW